MEQNWRGAVVPPDTTIDDALKVLDDTGLRLVMVANADGRLLGMVTDGDIRRALLRRVELGAPITEVMNPHPRIAHVGDSRDALRATMEKYSLLHIPIVDGKGRVVGLETYHHVLAPQIRENWVFLMAGGFGTRLRPLTDDCPKPMLPVGGKPILESILLSFIAAGFRRFYISVHYLAEKIKEHFDDGSRWGVTIRYIEESSPLGTGGALGLLPEVDVNPVIIMNGDVLTQLDFNALLDFHVAQQAALTLCVREYEMQVPFGVVEGDETRVNKIVEKPVHRFFVNAGIYVVSPKVVQYTHPPRRLDMPDLVDELLGLESKVSMFPIHEYWLDVGRPEDYASAQPSELKSSCGNSIAS
jgi:dTDP-glucose pyrophosphorylase